MEDLGYPSDENLRPSAKLVLFFKGVATALQRLREKIPKQLADESRKICAGALQKVLVKVAFHNPGLNFTNVLKTLPPDADLEALKALVAPIVDKVSGIKRIEGDRVDQAAHFFFSCCCLSCYENSLLELRQAIFVI